MAVMSLRLTLPRHFEILSKEDAQVKGGVIGRNWRIVSMISALMLLP